MGFFATCGWCFLLPDTCSDHCVFVWPHVSSADFERTFLFSTPSSCAIICTEEAAMQVCSTSSHYSWHCRFPPVLVHRLVAWELLCSESVGKLWKRCAMGLGPCGMLAKGHTGHGGHFGPLSKSGPGDWCHLLSNSSSSLSWLHMLPKTRPETFIIYCCSYCVVFVLWQEPKMLTALYEIYIKTVSWSLYSDTT